MTWTTRSGRKTLLPVSAPHSHAANHPDEMEDTCRHAHTRSWCDTAVLTMRSESGTPCSLSSTLTSDQRDHQVICFGKTTQLSIWPRILVACNAQILHTRLSPPSADYSWLICHRPPGFLLESQLFFPHNLFPAPQCSVRCAQCARNSQRIIEEKENISLGRRCVKFMLFFPENYKLHLLFSLFNSPERRKQSLSNLQTPAVVSNPLPSIVEFSRSAGMSISIRKS